VKTFAAVAATTRRMDANRPGIAEDKLATELVLVPTVLAPDAPPPGEEVDPDDPVPQQPFHPITRGSCSAAGTGGSPGLPLLLLLLAAGRRRRARKE
jgi:uncharacterized protein (TIGR03382 family)